jgi:hypothetical protein
MRAALYAGGTSGGIPEKVVQLVERHRGSKCNFQVLRL